MNSKNFSKFDANLEILEWRKWQTINIKDRISFEKFNQFTNRERVKGKLILTKVGKKKFSCFYDISLRAHGDQKDHRDGNKLPSLQIKIIDSNIFGITDFLLLRPSQRGYANEIFVSLLMRKINLLAPRTTFTNINYNNQNYKFLFQEKIRKEFLEFSGLKESVILEGDERFVFNKGDVPFVNHRISNKNFIKKNSANSYISEKAISKLNYYGSIHSTNTFRNSLVDYYYISKLKGKNDFVNLDLFDSIMFATDSLAGLSVQDRRFYFNAIEEKFYPIFYDGIPQLLDKNNNIINKKINYENLIIVKKLNHSFEFPSLFNGKVSYSSVLGSNKAKTEIEKINKVEFQKNLENYGLRLGTQKIDDLFKLIIKRLDTMSGFKKNKIIDLSILNENLFIFDFRNKRFKNQKIVFYSDSKNYIACGVYYLDCKDILKKNVYSHNLFSQDAKYNGYDLIFLGKKNTKNLNSGWFFQDIKSNFKSIKIKNIEIRYSKGISLNFDDNSKILYINKINQDGRVIIKNQKIENLKIEFNDFTKNTIEKKIEPHLIDKNGITGCITFYEVIIKNLNINVNNSMCEDGVNFIRSKGTINKIKVNNSISDAIDFDFSNIQTQLIDVKGAKNDCVDFSYGEYTIDKLNVLNCGDKGISVGEASILTVNKFISYNTNSAAVSKDNSILIIKNSLINNTNVCYSAYRKKQEFFGSQIKILKDKCESFVKRIDIDKNSILKND